MHNFCVFRGKMKPISTIFVLVLFFDLSEHYRILGLFPLPSTSHMIVFKKLMKELAERGHEVDVFSHFPQKEALPRYNDISIQGTLPTYNYTVPIIRAKLSNRRSLVKHLLFSMGVDLCQTILNSTAAKELKDTAKKYDLVITEVFTNDCMLGFAHRLKVPAVSIITSVSLPWGGDRTGNPNNPSYIPNYFLPYLSRMSFVERLTNTVTLLVTKLGYVVATNSANAIAQEFFGPDLPDLKDLAYNTSLILVNGHFSIDYVRPTVPNFVEVGGLHMEKLKPLPKHFQNSLADVVGYKGVIYVSMGSMVLIETLPHHKLQALFDTFRDLPYKILWKAVQENMPKNMSVPSNIQFEAWMPQLDILCHPNVKLFVTHGGLMGVQESVFCGVPIFGIPFFGDHEYSVRKAVAAGYGVMVDYENITKESISEAVRAVLEDTKYKSNAAKVSKLFKDLPLSAMDTAIYWIEYVIRYNGAPNLRSIGADLPWYQYHLVDVGVVLSLCAIMSITSICYLISYLACKVRFYCKSENKLKIH